MNLKEFFSYKNKLGKLFCSDEEIVKLIRGDVGYKIPATDLLYQNLFPYEFVPDTSDKSQTFVCYDVDIQYMRDASNKTFYYPVLYVWVIVHESNIRLEAGGTRTDKLSSEIDRLLNGSRFFGIGALELNSVSRWKPASDYLGRTLVYYAKDWNRASATAYEQRVPSNRSELP